MDRRTFLTMVAAATAGAGQFSWGADEHRIEKIGIQLFTVQDALQQDFEGTVAKIAAMGYREVELGGFCQDKPPKYVRAVLDRAGLPAPSNHFNWEVMRDNWPKVVEWCHVLGHRYIVLPYFSSKTADGWKSFASSLNRTGELAQKIGVQLCYHNHDQEFFPTDDGRLPYDILLKEFNPELVKMEMDLCWINVGRADPLKYFAQYPERFPLIHVKGLRKIPTAPNAADFKATDIIEVGDGVIDWKRIFRDSKQAGIKHYFVEQDNPKEPLKSAKVSYEYLARLRF